MSLYFMIVKRSSHRGFTLVEMSIVLVIIGLIIGGVLAGRDLIAAAAARAQITQIEKYRTAAMTFRNKYGYLPGDIPDPAAQQYGFAARGTAPGQGDGNGAIEGSDGATGYGDWGGQGEQPMFWVDLSVAKLVDGNFTGASATSNPSSQVDLGPSGLDMWFPQSKVGQSSHVYVFSGGLYQNCPCTSIGGKNGKNYFAISQVRYVATSGMPTIWRGIAPNEAYAIDAKADDGLPTTGKIEVIGGGGGVPEFTCGSACNELLTQAQAQVAMTKFSSSCYDNGGVAGVPRNYSVSNVNAPNCTLSLEF